jgi:chemotaxis protein methyltransferase CheR
VTATLDSTLSPAAYEFIAELVYQHSRIRLGADKQALVSGRLVKRLRALELDAFEDYCDLLRSAAGAAELGQLIDAISTNHTHFFREIEHLHFLRDTVLPELMPALVKAREPFRIWSAASSSGEEPYTIAIVLAEFVRLHGAMDWQIEGSDISTRVLAKARDGIYAAGSVQLPQPDLLPRYFQRGTGDNEGFYRVKDALRSRVKLHHLNLLQARYPVAPQQHVIFCRNVMIYFDNATQRKVLEHMHAVMKPRGLLYVGHSENFTESRDLFRLRGKTIYERV